MQRDHFNNGNPIANRRRKICGGTCFKIGVKKTTNKVVIFLHTRIRLFPSKVLCYDNSQCWSYMELLAAKGLQLEICWKKVQKCQILKNIFNEWWQVSWYIYISLASKYHNSNIWDFTWDSTLKMRMLLESFVSTSIFILDFFFSFRWVFQVLLKKYGFYVSQIVIKLIVESKL